MGGIITNFYSLNMHNKMKKILKTWNLWNILSIFLFVMTCWVFVTYATNTSNNWFFTNYNTGQINNTLTATWRNNLMGDLDNLIPEGAIMAFTSLCPQGWYELTGSNWKFLMWANSNFGNWWWNSSITLSVSQIPAHSHYIRYWKSAYKYWDNANLRPVAVDWDSGKYPISNEGTSTTDSAATGSWINTVKTQRVWSGSPIDILNPYIKVHYCVKWNLST